MHISFCEPFSCNDAALRAPVRGSIKVQTLHFYSLNIHQYRLFLGSLFCHYLWTSIRKIYEMRSNAAIFLDLKDKISVPGWELLSVLNISTASVCLGQIQHYTKNLELSEAWLALAFNEENANESIIGCNHLLTASVVLATISLFVGNMWVKVKVTVDRQCRGRDNTRHSNRQSYRATLRFTGNIFSFLLFDVVIQE